MPSTKVLLTGSTGFIGSHIVPLLVDRDYDVFVLERYVTGRFVLGQMRSVKTVFGDLREYSTIKKIISEVQPDIVIHLAAISPVAYSYEHPQEVIEANFMGTVNLAEACIREVPHFRHFLFASTSETYGNGPNPRREDTPQNPNSPYAVTKHACEKYLMYMRDGHNFPITILRPFNTYGRKDNTHFVVERTIVQMLQSETVRLGDPNPVRDLLYIDDHTNAYLTCLENEKAIGEVFNFSTGIGVSIKQLVEIISKLTGFEGEVIWNTIPPRPLDIMELIGDYTKAKKTLGWEPKFKLEDGLKRSIEYWRNKLLKDKTM
ncbi:MAG: NAD-dependent epimerase/dehydratase family protein [Candidatus Jordarchaeum sp.]|uniref:NAD-dependent epimerase/dehydratase family protein n=1 Tax=Candidatus Jordarchaeum sp. TaxID=2823881 RepID=UPI00404B2803